MTQSAPHAGPAIALNERTRIAARLPRQFYIEVTNKCNSLCKSCPLTYDHFLEWEPKHHLSWEQFRAIVDQAPVIERAVLHGIGEPLLNPDLPRMIAHLKSRGAHVLFNTNAVLLDEKRGDAVVEAGLDELRVSLDAMTPSLYAHLRGIDKLPRILDNLRAFAARRRAIAGLFLIVLAAHVKLTALIFVPAALVWLWRRDGFVRACAYGIVAGALGLGASWLLYQPLGGWASLQKNLYERSILSVNSIGELIYLYRRFVLGIPRWEAQIPTGRAMTLVFAGIALVVLLIWLRRRREAGLASLGLLCGATGLLYLTVGSFWFQPWYAVWVIGLAALAPESGLSRRHAPAFAASALFGALLADYARHSNPPLLAGWQLSALYVAALLLPQIALLLANSKFQIPNSD